MRNYLREYHQHIISMTPEETEKFAKHLLLPFPLGKIKPIDLIPTAVFIATILTLLQLFIPYLRQKETK